MYFDTSPRSRFLTKVGLVLCWSAGLFCLGFGICMVAVREGTFLNLDKSSKEIIPLVLNVLVTLINEALGYIHANSLRWSLQREGRLAFNSNLRLFTSVSASKANSWYANLLMLLSIIMSYASTSLIFVGDYGATREDFGGFSLIPNGDTTFVSGYALITLGLGISCQSLIATAALRCSASSPTWSSSPIDTAAAFAVDEGISFTPGRCMRSAHDMYDTALPINPRTRQKSAYRAYKVVRFVFYCLWGTVTLSFLWASVLIAVIYNNRQVNGIYFGYSWAFFPVVPSSVDLAQAQKDTNSWSPGSNADTSGATTLAIPWNVIGKFPRQNVQNPYVSFSSFCWSFALYCLLQTVLTISLHCAELVVSVVRDEKLWRRASSKSGLFRKPFNPIYALLVSGPGMTLFLLKPVLHWVFGLAVSSYFSVGLVMHAPQLIYLSTGILILATFISACALWQPKGPQPATFGHLQTLVNLIDEWPEKRETMFWGRKSEGSENKEVILVGGLRGLMVAHAGISAMKLEEVRFDEVYM